jgi:hypothetical protein
MSRLNDFFAAGSNDGNGNTKPTEVEFTGAGVDTSAFIKAAKIAAEVGAQSVVSNNLVSNLATTMGSKR